MARWARRDPFVAPATVQALSPCAVRTNTSVSLQNVPEARAGIDAYMGFYNEEWSHQALGYQTPREVSALSQRTRPRKWGRNPRTLGHYQPQRNVGGRAIGAPLYQPEAGPPSPWGYSL